jgi:N-acetylmuramoyl-L-alanine amidase
MIVLAPGLLSTTTGTPRASPSLGAIMRACRSVVPPGGVGTTIRRDLPGAGNPCAPATEQNAKARTTRQPCFNRFMTPLQVASGRKQRHGLPASSFWQGACARMLSALLVAVDVGHYAAEPGVISAAGIAEFQYNLALAQEVKAELEKREVKVRLIGEKGDYAVLYHRTRDAQGADLFVSIHHDSVKEQLLPQADRFAGFSLFISRGNPKLAQSLYCASAIGAQLRAAGFVPSRYHADPVTGAPRPFADAENGVHYYDNLAVARTATMPSVLVEAGVIVNREEERRMRDPQVRGRIATAVAQGVRECLTR